MDEGHILKRYKRLRNDYCTPYIPQIKKLKRRFKKLRTTQVNLREYINERLNVDPAYIKNAERVYKKHAINFTKLECSNPYIEFRMMGGKDYCNRVDEILKDVAHCCKAMRLAINKKAEPIIDLQLAAL